MYHDYCRGHVVTMEAVEKLIKKDMLDPINGVKMTDKDIIPLQRVRTMCSCKTPADRLHFILACLVSQGRTSLLCLPCTAIRLNYKLL